MRGCTSPNAAITLLPSLSEPLRPGCCHGASAGPACSDDLFNLSPAQIHERRIAVLPQSLSAALDALERDAVVCGALGDTLSREFVRIKRDEWLEYARHVSPWEMSRYAAAF